MVHQAKIELTNSGLVNKKFFHNVDNLPEYPTEEMFELIYKKYREILYLHSLFR